MSPGGSCSLPEQLAQQPQNASVLPSADSAWHPDLEMAKVWTVWTWGWPWTETKGRFLMFLWEKQIGGKKTVTQSFSNLFDVWCGGSCTLGWKRCFFLGVGLRKDTNGNSTSRNGDWRREILILFGYWLRLLVHKFGLGKNCEFSTWYCTQNWQMEHGWLSMICDMGMAIESNPWILFFWSRVSERFVLAGNVMSHTSRCPAKKKLGDTWWSCLM